MAECNTDNAQPQVSLKLEPASSKDGNIIFPYRLPKDDLALRSACIVNGVPELRFDASPKVPTIQEEEIATVFRLVSEDKCPEFSYFSFPPTHPMHQCRYFKQYCPSWLRGTAVGELLADVDWNMKCLHVGTKANKNKSVFKLWSAESQLEGLASHLDFPIDGFGPVMMSCDYATVQKDDDEIMFPEEPKMKITDGCSSLYSKYITEIYQSVAYYDEPQFLKMQELIKLIIAVKWLYKEKGVRVNQEWVMNHTSKPAGAHLKLGTRKKPPYNMIPKPILFERPTSDVTVKTMEAVLYETLETECRVQRRYGYYDFSSAQAITFKADGTPCPPQKCLKLYIEHHFSLFNIPTIKTEELHYLPVPQQVEPTRNEILKLLPALPENSRQEITSTPVPVSLDIKVDDLSDESGMELKVTNSAHCPPLMLTVTRVMTVTMGNSGKHFTDEDPKMPIPAGGESSIIPDVKSWDELISELSVPVPYIWQHPFVGIGEPMASGGVTTRGFTEKPPQQAKSSAYQETQRKDNYSTNGHLLGVRAKCIRTKGKYLPLATTTKHCEVNLDLGDS